MTAKTQRNVLLGVIVLLLIIGYFGCNKIANLKNDKKISEQNVAALTDSLRIEKNKVGDFEYSKGVLITDKKHLEDLNKDLADELEKEKGKVSQLTQIIASMHNDTIVINNTVVQYPNGDYGLKWKFDTTYSKYNSKSLEGTSNFRISDSIIVPLQTMITKDEITFNLITGLREKDGKYEIFARSDYPNLVISNIEGAILDPKDKIFDKFNKKKRFGVGPYIGVGLCGDLTFGLQVGIGFTYDIIRW